MPRKPSPATELRRCRHQLTSMAATADVQHRTIQVLKTENIKLREQIDDLRQRFDLSERRLDDVLHIARHGAKHSQPATQEMSDE